MKTVTGRIVNAKPLSLTKAAKLLSDFASADTNEASQDVSAYLQRAAAAFTELKSIHREIRSTKPRPDLRRDPNPIGESDGRANKVVDEGLMENGEKTRDHDEIKEEKKEKKKEEEVIVDEKLEEERKEKKEKKKSKKNKEEEEVVDEKFEEERKEKKKKKKSKKDKEEDVVEEKVSEELVEEERSEKRKEKKRKSDGEIGSEERKSKKRKKSKEIDG